MNVNKENASLMAKVRMLVWYCACTTNTYNCILFKSWLHCSGESADGGEQDLIKIFFLSLAHTDPRNV